MKIINPVTILLLALCGFFVSWVIDPFTIYASIKAQQNRLTRTKPQSTRSQCTPSQPCITVMVADLDTDSRKAITNNTYYYESRLMLGTVIVDGQDYNFHQILEVPLLGYISELDRGMELSEVVLWKNQLLTFDDRTGIVYELLAKKGDTMIQIPKLVSRFNHDITQIDLNKYTYHVIPRYILPEAEDSPKGMKIEWACVSENDLYIGSFGKEYTSEDGAEILGENNFWIVRIDHNLSLPQRINWKWFYNYVRSAVGASAPGYLFHEAVGYREGSREWVFLPRRFSTQTYNAVTDETMGSNRVIRARDTGEISTHFVNFRNKYNTRGFSSFKFLPGSDQNIIVALRSEEINSQNITRTYISFFDIDGILLKDEVMISSAYKYEGLEFL